MFDEKEFRQFYRILVAIADNREHPLRASAELVLTQLHHYFSHISPKKHWFHNLDKLLSVAEFQGLSLETKAAMIDAFQQRAFPDFMRSPSDELLEAMQRPKEKDQTIEAEKLRAVHYNKLKDNFKNLRTGVSLQEMQTINPASSLDSDRKTLKGFLRAAKQEEKQGNYEEAVRLCENAVAYFENNPILFCDNKAHHILTLAFSELIRSVALEAEALLLDPKRLDEAKSQMLFLYYQYHRLSFLNVLTEADAERMQDLWIRYHEILLNQILEDFSHRLDKRSDLPLEKFMRESVYFPEMTSSHLEKCLQAIYALEEKPEKIFEKALMVFQEIFQTQKDWLVDARILKTLEEKVSSVLTRYEGAEALFHRFMQEKTPSVSEVLETLKALGLLIERGPKKVDPLTLEASLRPEREDSRSGRILYSSPKQEPISERKSTESQTMPSLFQKHISESKTRVSNVPPITVGTPASSNHSPRFVFSGEKHEDPLHSSPSKKRSPGS